MRCHDMTKVARFNSSDLSFSPSRIRKRKEPGLAPSDSADKRTTRVVQNMMFVQSGVDGQLVRLGSFFASTTPGAPLGVS